MPHAWKAGEQTLLLRRQLEAMDDGGLVVLAVPASPSRCPPAPYERASLIAHYLKTKKPRSKVLILDAKDAFPQQRLFENAWKELYPGMIERVSLSQGGRVVSVDPATNTLVTDFGNYDGQVANVIPPQKAGRIAEHRRRSRQHRLVPDRSGDVCLKARAQHSCHRRRLHRRRHSEIRLRRERRSQGLRRRGGEPARRRKPRRCRSLTAPATTRSRPAMRSRCPASISRRMTSSPRSRAAASPARSMRRAKFAQREADNAQSWYQDHHGGNLWLGQQSISPASWLAAAALALPARPTRRNCGPIPSPAMPFRNR